MIHNVTHDTTITYNKRIMSVESERLNIHILF